jgi:hypothetical protein
LRERYATRDAAYRERRVVERMKVKGAKFPAERCVSRGVRLLQESNEMMARVRFGEARAREFVVFKQYPLGRDVAASGAHEQEIATGFCVAEVRNSR